MGPFWTRTAAAYRASVSQFPSLLDSLFACSGRRRRDVPTRQRGRGTRRSPSTASTADLVPLLDRTPGGAGHRAGRGRASGAGGRDAGGQCGQHRRRGRSARAGAPHLPGLAVVAVESALRDLDDLAGNAERVAAAATSSGPAGGGVRRVALLAGLGRRRSRRSRRPVCTARSGPAGSSRSVPLRRPAGRAALGAGGGRPGVQGHGRSASRLAQRGPQRARPTALPARLPDPDDGPGRRDRRRRAELRRSSCCGWTDRFRIAEAICMLGRCQAARVRRRFRSFGCCGVTDPVQRPGRAGPAGEPGHELVRGRPLTLRSASHELPYGIYRHGGRSADGRRGARGPGDRRRRAGAIGGAGPPAVRPARSERLPGRGARGLGRAPGTAAARCSPATPAARCWNRTCVLWPRSPCSCRSLWPTTSTSTPASTTPPTSAGCSGRTAEPLTPNWRHLPIGYHGRAGTVVSAAPRWSVRTASARLPIRIRARRSARAGKLDFEAELGFVVGVGSEPGRRVPTERFRRARLRRGDLNDWSARDLQAWEYVPLGPFLGKSFATSISAWVLPLAALDGAAARCPAGAAAAGVPAAPRAMASPSTSRYS